MKPTRTRQQGLPLGLEAKPKFTGGGFVSAVRLRRDEVPGFDDYPFHIPAIRSLERLELLRR